MTAANLAAISSAIDAKTASAVATSAQVPAVVVAQIKILAEAKGSAIDATFGVNPVVTDYAAMGVTVARDTKTFDLLNDVAGGLTTTAVDTLAEMAALATIANLVMKSVGSDARISITAAQFLALGITGVTAANLAAVLTAITATNDNGSEIDTVAKLQPLTAEPVNLQVLKDFTDDPATTKTASTPILVNYTNIGIGTVTSLSDGTRIALTASNTDLAAIDSAADALTGDSTLTKAKVQLLVDSCYRIFKEADGNTTNDTDVYPSTSADDLLAADYANVDATVGITSKTLGLLNDVVGGLSAALDTVTEINALATTAGNIMKQARGDTGISISNAALVALGLTGVTFANASRVLAAIAASNDDGSEVDTLVELQALDSLQFLKDHTNDAATTKTSPTPTSAQYTSLGIDNVTRLTDSARIALTGSNNNLAAIKSAIDALTGDATLTKAKVQLLIDSYYRILAQADGNRTVNTDVYSSTANDNPLALDCTNIGATVGSFTKTLDLINDAVGSLNAAAVDTVAEINALALTAESIMKQARGESGITLTVAQLTSLGVTGVSASKLATVLAAIAATNDNGTEADTMEELQALVSLQVLKDYTNDVATTKTALTPTLTHYNDLGLTTATRVTDVTRIPLSGSNTVIIAINTAFDKFNGDATLTTAKLQLMVDSYYRILKEADGLRGTNTDVYPLTPADSPLAAGYTNIGATVATTLTTQVLLNDVIGGLTSAAVDTVDEINTLAITAENLMKQANGYTGITITDAEFSNLGLVGVTSSNLAGILTSFAATSDDGTGADSYAGLQSLISLSRIQDYAVNSSNALLTVFDYTLIISLTGFNASYFSAYNSVVNITSLDNVATELQPIITAYNLILDETNGAAADATVDDSSAANYATIGVTVSPVTNGANTVSQATTLALLNDVVGGLTTSAVDSVSELTNIETIIESLMCMPENAKTISVTNSGRAKRRTDANPTGQSGLVRRFFDDQCANFQLLEFSDLFSQRWLRVQYIGQASNPGDHCMSQQNTLNLAVADVYPDSSLKHWETSTSSWLRSHQKLPRIRSRDDVEEYPSPAESKHGHSGMSQQADSFMQRFALLAFSVSLALAAPCAHAQYKLTRMLSSPPDAAQSSSQGRSAPAVSAASGTALTLRSLLASASANNPTLAAVRLESRATAQQITSAERQRWPTISAVAETNTGSLTSAPSRFLRIQQTLWDAGRKSARIDEAKTQSDIGLTNIDLQQQDLFIQIVNAWQSLIGASERVKVAEEALKRLLGYQAQMTRRVDAQASPTIDLELVNSRLLQTQVELVSAKTSQRVALTQLEQLTVATALAERVGLIELPPTVESTQPFANALSKIDWEFVASENPTVSKARFEVALARNRLDARRAEKWPELYARVDQPIGRTLTTRDTKATGFIGFTYTPGAGFSSLSEEQAQTTRIASQEQALASSVRTMEATLRNDHEEFINARARIAALDKSVSGSTLVLESYQRQFQAGRKTWQDLLNAVREVAQNQYAAAEAQAAMVGAMHRLEIRIGQIPHFQ